MSEKTSKRIEIFNDTLEQCKNNDFLFAKTEILKDSTYFVRADELPKFVFGKKRDPKIIVSNKRSLTAAKDILNDPEYKGGRVCILNFASAVSPGGGTASGSSTQEESLCRCSNLFCSLNQDFTWHEFYMRTRYLRNNLYSDDCIYSKGVTVFKSDVDLPEMLPKNEWYDVDVITCAAPNLSKRVPKIRESGKEWIMSLSDNELYDIHVNRAVAILKTAAMNGDSAIVLGAFGCGAFNNNPKVVAEAYKDVLRDWGGLFRLIEFAVYDAHNEGNFEIFKKMLDNGND